MPDRNCKIASGGGGNSHKVPSERAKSQNRDSEGKFSENGLSSHGKDDKINLTKQEWAQYYRFVNDPQNKGAVFKGKKGETYVRLETKIVIKQYGKFSVKSFRDNDTMNDFLNSELLTGDIIWE